MTNSKKRNIVLGKPCRPSAKRFSLSELKLIEQIAPLPNFILEDRSIIQKINKCICNDTVSAGKIR